MRGGSALMHPGCHGWEIAPAAVGRRFGWTTVDPRRRATVRLVRAAEPLWNEERTAPGSVGIRGQAAEDIPRPGSQPHEVLWRVERRHDGLRAELCRLGPQTYGYRSTEPVTMIVDILTSSITVSGPPAGQLRTVATFGIPLLAQATGALVLHAAAVADAEGRATLVCARSGLGKSTTCVLLVARGWTALSDDVCIVDVGRRQVWPGPRWTRLRRGDLPSGRGWRRRFEDESKTAWDLVPRMRHLPADIDRLIFLRRSPTPPLQWRPLPAESAVGQLAAHAPWLLDPEQGPRHLFPAAVRLARRVPAFELTVPQGRDWAERAAAVLDGG